MDSLSSFTCLPSSRAAHSAIKPPIECPKSHEKNVNENRSGLKIVFLRLDICEWKKRKKNFLTVFIFTLDGIS